MTSVPVTDAFDNSTSMDLLEVELTSAQVEWLEQTAEERGVSVGHVLRTIVTAQMRTDEEQSRSMASGDGMPVSFSGEEPESASADETSSNEASANTSSDPDHLLNRLRSTNQQLKKISEKEEDNAAEENREPDPSTEPEDAAKGKRAKDAASLFPHIDDSMASSEDSPTERHSEPAPREEEGERSMFEMVEE